MYVVQIITEEYIQKCIMLGSLYSHSYLFIGGRLKFTSFLYLVNSSFYSDQAINLQLWPQPLSTPHPATLRRIVQIPHQSIKLSMCNQSHPLATSSLNTFPNRTPPLSSSNPTSFNLSSSRFISSSTPLLSIALHLPSMTNPTLSIYPLPPLLSPSEYGSGSTSYSHSSPLLPSSPSLILIFLREKSMYNKFLSMHPSFYGLLNSSGQSLDQVFTFFS
jgi:hypothetical protein